MVVAAWHCGGGDLIEQELVKIEGVMTKENYLQKLTHKLKTSTRTSWLDPQQENDPKQHSEDIKK